MLVEHDAFLQLLFAGCTLGLCRLKTFYSPKYAQVPVPWLESNCGSSFDELNVFSSFCYITIISTIIHYRCSSCYIKLIVFDEEKLASG